MTVYTDFLKELSEILGTSHAATGPSVARSQQPDAHTQNTHSEKSQDKSTGKMPAGSGKAVITSPFGMRIHPIHKDQRMHEGVDIAAGKTPTYAVIDGEIIFAGLRGSAGNMVILRHIDRDNNKHEYVYMHLDSISVKKGQKVQKGEQIGIMGKTGNVTGVHLHLEHRFNGQPVPPSNEAIRSAVPGSIRDS